MRKSEKKGPNFLGSKGPIFKLVSKHIRNPYIKSDNLAKTESLIIFVEEKLAINSLLDLEFVKSFTPVASKIPKFFNFSLEKTPKLRYFWPQIGRIHKFINAFYKINL